MIDKSMISSIPTSIFFQKLFPKPNFMLCFDFTELKKLSIRKDLSKKELNKKNLNTYTIKINYNAQYTNFNNNATNAFIFRFYCTSRFDKTTNK